MPVNHNITTHNMPNRHWESEGYRFGFQGQENENDLYGEGNASFFSFRISDNRLGRFLSIDPLCNKYPFYSPYAFSGNRVIDAYEEEGLQPVISNTKMKCMEFTGKLIVTNLQNWAERGKEPTYQPSGIHFTWKIGQGLEIRKATGQTETIPIDDLMGVINSTFRAAGVKPPVNVAEKVKSIIDYAEAGADFTEAVQNVANEFIGNKTSDDNKSQTRNTFRKESPDSIDTKVEGMSFDGNRVTTRFTKRTSIETVKVE